MSNFLKNLNKISYYLEYEVRWLNQEQYRLLENVKSLMWRAGLTDIGSQTDNKYMT